MNIRKPHLVQRGTINRPLAKSDMKLGDAINFDYMGSAEFEFGALPKSLRRIEDKAAALVQTTVPEICDGDGRSLRVWSILTGDDFVLYLTHLHAMRAGKYRLKERSCFDADPNRSSRRIDFWWDIQNDVMWGFDKAFMNRLGDYLATSFAYMKSERAKRQADQDAETIMLSKSHN